MKNLIAEINNCRICQTHLPFGANPIISVDPNSKIAIIGQAPGIVVHQSGKPWDDKSGERLRDWLGVDETIFYDASQFALVPMGFCYPGKGESGDLPPRKECAPHWHERLFEQMDSIKLILLIGAYAQSYYLKNLKQRNLTKTVRNFETYLPKYFPLPHPSPRNNIWLKKNEWFEIDLVPILRHTIMETLKNKS